MPTIEERLIALEKNSHPPVDLAPAIREYVAAEFKKHTARELREDHSDTITTLREQVERLEAALAKMRDEISFAAVELFEASDKLNVAHCDFPSRERHQQQTKVMLAEKSIRASNAAARLRAALTEGEPQKSDEDVAPCFICKVPFVADDMVLPDETEGLGHAACFGSDREGYTMNGEPLGPDDPIPTGSRYGDRAATDAGYVPLADYIRKRKNDMPTLEEHQAPKRSAEDRIVAARRALLDLNLPQMPFERADLIVQVVAKELGYPAAIVRAEKAEAALEPFANIKMVPYSATASDDASIELSGFELIDGKAFIKASVFRLASDTLSSRTESVALTNAEKVLSEAADIEKRITSLTEEETQQPKPLTEVEFIEQFIAHMCRIVPSKNFEHGGTVEEYATLTALSYWNDGMHDNDPEAAAASDVESWNG